MPAPPSQATFYHVAADIAAQPTSSIYCANQTSVTPPALSRYCFPQAQNPSTMHLANGDIAVAYSILTGHTSSTCPTASSLTNSRVGFSRSTDGGLSFGGITYVGNDSCPYVNAIEPSFGVSNSGPIYGTFVEENFSNASNAFEPGLPPDYGNRTTDALGFVSSTDNGTTFTAVRTIVSGGNIARPQLGAIGRTIYIVFTDTRNGTTPLGQPLGITRPAPLPESVKFIASVDAGATWSSPTTLPGQNVTSAYTAFGASIAVSVSGTVAVAYATNRTCLVSPFSSCTGTFGWLYGENVVVTTSTNNGTTWNGPYTVGPGAAEGGCYGYDNATLPYFYPDPCLAYLFELTPQTTITFGATSQTIYVAWSGGHAPYYYYVENSNVNAAVSTNFGRSWNWTTVADPLLANSFTYNEFSTPALGFSGGTVYLSYLEKNGTNCFISNYCSLLLGSYIEWATTSRDGLTWTNSTFLTLESSSEYTPRWLVSFSGYTGSIAFNGAGHPVIAFALNQRPSSATAVVGNVTYQRFNFGTVLDVAVGDSGPMVNLTFKVTGNPPLSSWNFTVDGVGFAPTAGATSYVVSRVPAGQLVKVDGPAPTALAYGKEFAYTRSVPELSMYAANTTIWFNGTTEFGLAFSYEPPQFPQFCMCLTLNGAYYIYIPITATYAIAFPPLPWFFPSGTRLLIQPQINPGSDPTLYYVGTGNGSHTGPGTWANVTMNGPVNETVWNGLIGNSSLNVTAAGLPTGTSYTFQVDGVTHSGVAGTPSYVSNLNVGPHPVSGAQAAGVAGFEWFGSPSVADPVVPYETNVTLTFASVDLTSTLGTVYFHALGLLPGASWTVSFNGTLYATSTAWINVSSRSGTFPFGTFSAVTLGGQAGYVPTTVGPRITVASGATVDVNYTAAYEVRVAAGVGGTVSSPLTQFLAPGATVSLHATALSGYAFVGWSGIGNGSYSGSLAQTNVTVGSPIEENALFAALPGARFNLTFTESGIPAGTWWGVQLNGVSYASNSSILRVANLSSCSAGAAGLYGLAVLYAVDGTVSGVRYVVTGANATICTTGLTLVPLQFTSQYLVSTTASIAGPSVSATCGLSVGVAVWCDSSGTVSLAAPAVTGYNFAGWQGSGSGSYTGPSPSAQFVPTGPVGELAEYLPQAPPPTYVLTLSPSPGFAAGTEWTVTVAGHAYSSSSPTLVVPGLSNGSVSVVPSLALSPDGGTRYAPAGSVSVPISGDTHATLPFGVSFHGTVSSGTGGIVGPASGWFPANSTVALTANPSAGYKFQAWSATGSAFSGTDANGSFQVVGAFTELATFVPIGSAGSTTPAGTTSIWSSPVLWIALGLVGLIVGVAAGILLARGRPPAPATESPHPDGRPNPEERPGPQGGSADPGDQR
jgi:List-Bact-rpt repeat protein